MQERNIIHVIIQSLYSQLSLVFLWQRGWWDVSISHIRHVSVLLDTIQFGIHSEVVWTTLWDLCFWYLFYWSLSNFTTVTQSVWIPWGEGSTNTLQFTPLHWMVYIITMRKENVTSLVPEKYKIFCKVLPSTKLSLPDIQVISSLGIESRLFGHNWNAGHNYGPLLTHCDIVPGAATISQLHKHTLVCFCYYHSLPKTQMSTLITNCHHANPALLLHRVHHSSPWGPYPRNPC